MPVKCGLQHRLYKKRLTFANYFVKVPLINYNK